MTKKNIQATELVLSKRGKISTTSSDHIVSKAIPILKFFTEKQFLSPFLLERGFPAFLYEIPSAIFSIAVLKEFIEQIATKALQKANGIQPF